MKISIIVPVYNEEKLIGRCIRSLLHQEYPKKDYEIIVVNDGSTDKTLNEVKKYPIRVVDLKKNQGRSIARESGAKAAKYDNLLFIDARCAADKDILKNIKKIGYQPVVGTALTDINRSVYDRLFWLIRRKIYHPYFGENFKPVFINKKNFDSIGKGTTVLFCNKNLFLSSQIEDKENKSASDDIELLWNIVLKKPIIRHPSVKVLYITRNGFKEQFNHLSKYRGLTFVDYYFKPGKKYFPHILLLLAFTLFTIIIILLKPIFLFYELAILLLIDFIMAVWLSERISDFILIFVFLPIIVSFFSLGIIRGVLYKSIREISR